MSRRTWQIGGVWFALAFLLAGFAWTGTSAQASSRLSVYTATNAPDGNTVVAFRRNSDGTLGSSRSFATRGRGTGAGLGSQGSLIMNEDGRLLFVVNAGSDEVSSFNVDSDGDLDFADKIASGGHQPISLTVHDDALYVLNAGSSSISGFHVSKEGHLSPLAGSTRPLSGADVGPAEVQFSPNGRQLLSLKKPPARSTFLL